MVVGITARRGTTDPTQKPVSAAAEAPAREVPVDILKVDGKTPVYSALAIEIESQLKKNSYRCAVCTEVIKRRSATWACDHCYRLFHLHCVHDWAQSTIPAGAGDEEPQRERKGRRRERKSKRSGGVDERTFKWRCPGCQLFAKGMPKTYFCFCKKTAHPPDTNGYLTPHSCGKVCGRSRGHGCPHPCTLPCHPGSCPPCRYIGPPESCPCGKTQRRRRCGDPPSKPCGQVCGKLLEPCLKHRCTRSCHTGPCGPCTETEPQTCFCEKTTDEKRPCGSGVFAPDGKRHFTCDSPCGKLLKCGEHKCQRRCHAGPCPTCPRAPPPIGSPQPCACGASASHDELRKRCTDPIWTCSAPCGRLLECGHRCRAACHDSPCPPCAEHVTVTCRCAGEQWTGPCHKLKELKSERKSKGDAKGDAFGEAAFLCKQVCGQLLSCKRHRCTHTCCPAAGFPPGSGHVAHKCSRVCGKRLSCGLHTCPAPCHSGRCAPCGRALLDGISCFCGRTRTPGPLRCGAVRPVCKLPCAKPRPCGHPCGLPCHDGECPPCSVLIPRRCAGNHMEFKVLIKCGAPAPSCGRKCGIVKACNIHTCVRYCHEGRCSSDKGRRIQRGPLDAPPTPPESSRGEQIKGLLPDEVWSCGVQCGVVRPCGHPCTTACHPTHPCPPTRCNAKITLRCKCGRITATTRCSFAGGSGDNAPPKRNLECDDACKKAERNRRLREAFYGTETASADGAGAAAAGGLQSADTASSLAPAPGAPLPYPAELLQVLSTRLTKPLLSFLKTAETSLGGLVRNSVSGGTKDLYFKTMSGQRRWLVRLAAAPMALTVESLDSQRGSSKSLRVTRSFMSTRPRMLLSEAVRRFKADPQGAKTVPPEMILYVEPEGSDGRPVSAHELRAAFKRWEAKSALYQLGNGSAVAVFPSHAAAEDAADALRQRGLEAEVGESEQSASPSDAKEETGRRTSRRRARKAAKQWTDDDDEDAVESAAGPLAAAGVQLKKPIVVQTSNMWDLLQDDEA